MKRFLLPFILLSTLFTRATLAKKTIGTVDLPKGTERRLALLMGNKDYTQLRPLNNTHRDVDSMAKVLKYLGFEVIVKKDLDYQKTIVALNDFGEKIKHFDLALFYYSGHGVGYNNQTFLLPKETNITCLEKVEEQGVSLNRILKDMALATNLRNSFVFMDNCRNLSQFIRPCTITDKDGVLPIGLTMPKDNPKGRMVVFATQEGTTADDDTFDKYNSLFTEELIKYLRIPNLGIRDIIDKVADGMETRSKGKQTPERLENLRGNFVFVRPTLDLPEPMTPMLSPQSLYEKGKALFDQKKYVEALPFIKEAAGKGNSDAQYQLGVMYYNGTGIIQDLENALKYFDDVIKNNPQNINATVNIALCYETKKDWEKALFYYDKALDINNTFNLALRMFVKNFKKLRK